MLPAAAFLDLGPPTSAPVRAAPRAAQGAAPGPGRPSTGGARAPEVAVPLLKVAAVLAGLGAVGQSRGRRRRRTDLRGAGRGVTRRAAAPAAVDGGVEKRPIRPNGYVNKNPSPSYSKALDATVPKRIAERNTIEILSPSEKWRRAHVVDRGNDGVQVHYDGFDASYDEFIPYNSKRIRASGTLRKELAMKHKSDYTAVRSKDKCPGCGAKFQTKNALKSGYIAPDILRMDEVSGVGTSLTLSDEVDFLLGVEGDMESEETMQAMLQAPNISFGRFTRWKVVANVSLELRKEPDVNAERHEGRFLNAGETFYVENMHVGADGRNYLQLQKNKGWAFDWHEIDGVKTKIAEIDISTETLQRQAVQRQKDTVCIRCHQLWHQGLCDDVFRTGNYKNASGISSDPELSAEKFEQVMIDTLAPVTDNSCVWVVADIFDFQPSFYVMQLLAKMLVGKPDIRVFIIANKMDLLPKDVNTARIRGWVSRQANWAGLSSVRLADVFPLSCYPGYRKKYGWIPIRQKMHNVKKEKYHYMVGAANAGKSSVLNMMTHRFGKSWEMSQCGRMLPQGVQHRAPTDCDGVTVSRLPGTTLSPMRMKFLNGQVELIDLPGILYKGSYSNKLTLQDMRYTVGRKEEMDRLTMTLRKGLTMFIGGLVRIEMISGTADITAWKHRLMPLHMTSTKTAETSTRRLIEGNWLKPPLEVETFDAMGEWKPHSYEYEGYTWDEAICDISIPGACWFSVTTQGTVRFKVWVPEGVDVVPRDEPLMPLEAKWTSVKSTEKPGTYKWKGKFSRGKGLQEYRLRMNQKF